MNAWLCASLPGPLNPASKAVSPANTCPAFFAIHSCCLPTRVKRLHLHTQLHVNKLYRSVTQLLLWIHMRRLSSGADCLKWILCLRAPKL